MSSNAPFTSPVAPVQLDGDHRFNFRCYKGIGCFNACCRSIDITLTPYDILRLKNRLDLSSSDFLAKYTAPFEFEKDSIAGVKLRTRDDTTECQFMTEEGCSVYEDRPTACRYYPVALVSLRKQDEFTDTASYALVKEAHCLGHNEPRELSIDEYRAEQGVQEYDDLARGWRQLILKKKSSGPAVGKPSLRSRQLFFMACYDIDRFRTFVMSDGFRNSFELPDEEVVKMLANDVELLQFSFRFLRQVLFGEETITIRAEAREAIERKQREAFAAEMAPPRSYDPGVEPTDL
jgi:Fe-S-cluster containining protein